MKTINFQNSRQAAKDLLLLSDQKINEILIAIADKAEHSIPYLLKENVKDLERMDSENPMYDRLMLTEARIKGIAGDLRNVASLPSPLYRTLSSYAHPQGMQIDKVAFPFGVIGVIFEARPNVCFDVFALCFKSGNTTILKGGSDAQYSNMAIVALIRSVLSSHFVNPDTVTLLPPSREITKELLEAHGEVDLIIPRGSQGLIKHVRETSKIPVIETGAGICHTYFHASGDVGKGNAIVVNAKTRRVSVCNALDCLLIDRSRLSDLSAICVGLEAKNVIIYADPEAFAALKGNYPDKLLKEADGNSFGTEFLDYKMSIKSVDSFEQALAHIDRHSSKHSESIVAEDSDACTRFQRLVDAACVYANVSTAFTDGAQFGLGAEIGISTQKMHARGPMALQELTTYKFLISGQGQTRS